MEDGTFQLSVYIEKQKKFYEVIVDHMTGKIGKSEEITKGEDAPVAKAQGDAMDKAKKGLRAAATRAVSSNPGYRAVSVIPDVKDGKPIATIVLENASGTKTVSESLD
jgi:hypothetical protein